MKTKNYITLLSFIFLTISVWGQKATQTVRGTVIDLDSKIPLAGVNIIIRDSEPLKGTATDKDGNFRLTEVPVGRISLHFSYMGYETKTFHNLEVRAGKELILNVELQESVQNMEQVTIKASRKRGEALNEMTLVSARAISLEESKRFAGGFDDPSRVVSNYAGVAATADGSSDIIVRGNAPKYMQWQIEGIESTSPYHFDDQNSSYGALSALNNNLLATSDFYTGAFSPEYGNVLSSVYNVKIRNGNNEKFEAMAGIGLIGTDLTFEGPFKKGYSGSYLVNYRYSTTSLLNDLGMVDLPGLFNFQDATFKISLPANNYGTFSIFGFGGLDNVDVINDTSIAISKPGNVYFTENSSVDYTKNNYLFNAGISHIISLDSKSYFKTIFVMSGNGMEDEIFRKNKIMIYDNQNVFLRDSVISKRKEFDNNIEKLNYRLSLTYNHKINSKNRLKIGSKYSLSDYKFNQDALTNDTTLFNVIDLSKKFSILQNFISWQYRPNKNLTLVAGIHNMNIFLNNTFTIEPRLAANWKLNEKNSFHVGYGKHSVMESIHHYYARVQQADGSITEPNKNLGLLKSHHIIAGYKKQFSNKLSTQLEIYYQYLYNLPVENNDASIFATINEGIEYKYVDLVNKGTGENYGLELTLERFFDKNYYFLFNGTLYNSTYKALDGVERNTQYNQNFLTNFLFGKEFHIGKKDNKTLGLNAKAIFQGGRKYIPLLRDEAGNPDVDVQNNMFWDYSRAYENQLDNIFQLNLSVSYKWNKKKRTHELFLDLQNITNNTAKIKEYYDESEAGSVGYLKQLGFFPNIMYRFYF